MTRDDDMFNDDPAARRRGQRGGIGIVVAILAGVIIGVFIGFGFLY